MTSPRTPRQWTEADIVDWPKDHPDVKDRRGTTWRWYPERDFYVTDWNEAASWMQLCKNLGPLSEVLPETPEPPQEDRQLLDWIVPDHIGCVETDGYVEITCRAVAGECSQTTSVQNREWIEEFLTKHAHGQPVKRCPVPASQSVPAVPVSSTGGAGTREDEEAAQATSEAWTLHTAIAAGIKRGLADFGAELTGCTASALTGHVISQLREAGLHLPLSDSEPEPGSFADAFMRASAITADMDVISARMAAEG